MFKWIRKKIKAHEVEKQRRRSAPLQRKMTEAFADLDVQMAAQMMRLEKLDDGPSKE